MPTLARIPDADHQLRTLRYELGRLDRKSVETLRAEVAQAQQAYDQAQAEARQLDQHVGGLEVATRTLESETIPQLERAADEAAQRAAQFISAENASEMQVEVEQEYARRRERQPLETVLLNATRL